MNRLIVHAVGARPNLVKIAPMIRAVAAQGGFTQILVHTGQHYDSCMSQTFFDELSIPNPDIFLGIGSASHVIQTARIMIAFERVLLEKRPDLVLVVGDVNSTLACALTAVKLQIPVVHVEAGLRSYDRAMPEEINRIVTDAISDLLFTTEPSGTENLRAEGIPAERIYFVGNVMIDTLYSNLPRAQALNVLSKLGLHKRGYALLTLHRPANVDDITTLTTLLKTIRTISEWIPVLFPVHPRTWSSIKRFGLEDIVTLDNRIRIAEPLGYLAFLNVMSNARLVLTDSGGVQEETTVLGIPCLTLREKTERPITVSEGTNMLVGTVPEIILEETQSIIKGKGKLGRVPDKWDGHASERIATVLSQVYAG